MRKLLVVFFVAILIISLNPISKSSAATQTLSVKLMNYVGNVSTLDFQFIGEYKLTNDDTVNLSPNVLYTIKVENNQLVLYEGSKKIKALSTTFTLDPKEYGPSNKISLLSKTTKSYLGSMKFELESGKNVRPTNVNIPFEDYLKGVVPHEMPASWHIEALKAQAVSARSYAVANGYVGKIITDTQSHQVYGGYEWHQNSTNAVNQTSGELLKYGNNVITTVYSSSNGGVTESNSNAWGSDPLPYYPVKVDQYDPKNPWNVTVHKTQINLSGKDLSQPSQWWSSATERDVTITNNIKAFLANNGYADTEIKIVNIPELTIDDAKNSSGRSLTGSIKVEFFIKDKLKNEYVMENGKIKTYVYENNLSVNSIRSIIGGSLIKSSLIDKYVNSTTTRLGGKDRFEVAVNVSKQGWDQSNTVILANYLAFADALSATPLAYQENAPVLLTHPDKLTSTTEAELKRLNAKNVIVVGGPPSVSGDVTKRIEQLGISWERIGGHDRYEVAYNVSKRLDSTDTAVVAYGLVFSDALSIAPYAAKHGYPILLTKTNVLPPETVKALNENNIKKTVVSGGEPSVGREVYNKLPAPTRLDGKDRYEVAANIANNLGLSKEKAFLATGLTFADALTGSVLAAKNNAPVLLTRPESLPPSIENYIANYEVSNFTVLGGPSSVSNSIVSKLPNDSYSIAGRGYGHGVGMSQYGAYGMAKAGKNYKDILSFYFPGTDVR
jgi:SpoIID/LytB domain protein